MKTRFTTIDIVAVMADVQDFLDLRVQNVYDIDSKTYLIKLHRAEKKAWLLLESGARVHPTEFEWRKSSAPSSYSMKLRKHIKQKRLTAARQLGVDRVVELKFGEGEVACHLLIELYDRGNLVLTDSEHTILNILRPRTDKDHDVRFAVRQRYPVELARQNTELSRAELSAALVAAKPGDNLRKVLAPKLQYGPALLEHALKGQGLASSTKATPEVEEKVAAALAEAEEVFQGLRKAPGKGYLITKTELKPSSALLQKEGEPEKEETLKTFAEFHPFLPRQFADGSKGEEWGWEEREHFYQAVDAFFSSRETGAIDRKALAQERDALKKLDNIWKDHERRLGDLAEAQRTDAAKADLIAANSALVDRAILVLRSAVANQLSWPAIRELVDEGRDNGDPVAEAIQGVQLDKNILTLALADPYSEGEEEGDEEGPMTYSVDIDLGLGAHQNARRYYDHRKAAGVKEAKTITASKKALKSAEAKTLETLAHVQVKTVVQKQRKVFWFEKFLWFVSSDGYLVIGGRDAAQNELLVKRYLGEGDVYVHADLRGASSVVVKNRKGAADADIPPKTLHEAGTMAVCNSAAWEAKVVAGSWWVSASQVSKTAPSGEYLTAGSFMIRGKKNFMPPANLQMGFGFLFRLEEESVEERKAAGVPGLQGALAQTSAAVPEDAQDKKPEEEPEGEELPVEADGGDSEEETAFPDVAVKLEHLSVSTEEKGGKDEEFTLLHLGPKAKPEPSWKAKKEEAKRRAAEQEAKAAAEAEAETAVGGAANKRGQKTRRAKLKSKYADQDEEERLLRMEILASAGAAKDKKLKGKAKKKAAAQAQVPRRTQPAPKPSQADKEEEEEEKEDPAPAEEAQTAEEPSPESDEKAPKTSEAEPSVAGEEKQEKEEKEEKEEKGGEEEEEEEERGDDEVTEALSSLTARPLHTDLLVFALPVCAPYAATSTYKYRAKLTPGTGKKGKACKSALAMFLQDKQASQREKDLLKASQDSDLGRNLPGKVKVSAPHLLASKQKK